MRRGLAALAVLALACSGAAEPEDNGRLLVTGGEGDVALVDPETGERTRLADASLHGGPVQPTASRDGSIVVWSGVNAAGVPLVHVHEEAADRAIDVPTLPYYYAFDSSGSTLAALGNDPDGAGVALLLVDLEADRAEIVEVGQPYYLDWHPREPALVVHVGAGELAVLEEGERETLDVGLGEFQAPAWTGDGRVLVPLRSEGATASLAALGQAEVERLAVVDPADGSETVVAPIDEMVMFAATADRVAYMEGDAGLGPLRVVDLDGGQSQLVAPGDVIAFEWSPSGERLLFLTVEPESGLVPHVWDGETTTDHPGFLPTGVFLTQYLPFWSQYMRTITPWAPDDSAFAYADGEDEGTVWVQPLQGDRREAGEGVMVSWIP